MPMSPYMATLVTPVEYSERKRFHPDQTAAVPGVAGPAGARLTRYSYSVRSCNPARMTWWYESRRLPPGSAYSVENPVAVVTGAGAAAAPKTRNSAVATAPAVRPSSAVTKLTPTAVALMTRRLICDGAAAGGSHQVQDLSSQRDEPSHRHQPSPVSCAELAFGSGVTARPGNAQAAPALLSAASDAHSDVAKLRLTPGGAPAAHVLQLQSRGVWRGSTVSGA